MQTVAAPPRRAYGEQPEKASHSVVGKHYARIFHNEFDDDRDYGS
ncbi:hypothetical protein [Lonsdalea quercina]